MALTYCNSLRLSSQHRAVPVCTAARSVFHGVSVHQFARAKGLQLAHQRRCSSTVRRAAQVVRASFFGVGAPEAVLVAVVALVVFGPKGLAEAARGVGQALRQFQPTIRELTEVSSELQQTLKKEIGLDEIQRDINQAAVPTPRPRITGMPEDESSATASSSSSSTQELKGMTEEQAKLIDPSIEQKRAEAAKLAWGGAAAATDAPATATANSSTTNSSSSIPAVETPPAAPPLTAAVEPEKKDVTNMSVEELEAELARRKAAARQSS